MWLGHNFLLAQIVLGYRDIRFYHSPIGCILPSGKSHIKLLPPVDEILSGLMITYYSDIHSQLKAINLDERQVNIIEFTLKNGRITNADVQELLLCHKYKKVELKLLYYLVDKNKYDIFA